MIFSFAVLLCNVVCIEEIISLFFLKSYLFIFSVDIWTLLLDIVMVEDPIESQLLL